MATCIRIYANGSRVTEIEENPKEWLDYNQQYRFGCALFINGECKQRGYLTEEQCKEISKELKNEKIPETHYSPISVQ